MILHCGCTGRLGNSIAARQQDEWYGAGNRVHNDMAKEDYFRCTICGTERSTPKKSMSKEEAAAAAKDEKGKKLAAKQR